MNAWMTVIPVPWLVVFAATLLAALLVLACQVSLVTVTFVLVCANFSLNETLFDFARLVTASLCLMDFISLCFVRFLGGLSIFSDFSHVGYWLVGGGSLFVVFSSGRCEKAKRCSIVRWYHTKFLRFLLCFQVLWKDNYTFYHARNFVEVAMGLSWTQRITSRVCFGRLATAINGVTRS